jgi:hypothetical protein
MSQEVKSVTKYDILLIAFVGSIMAQTGCGREEALKRVATLCALTEEQLGTRVELLR